jgi:hypothetical protein
MLYFGKNLKLRLRLHHEAKDKAALLHCLNVYNKILAM